MAKKLLLVFMVTSPLLCMIEDDHFKLPQPTDPFTINFINKGGSRDVIDTLISQHNGPLTQRELDEALKYAAFYGYKGSAVYLFDKGAQDLGGALLAAAHGVKLEMIQSLFAKITRQNLHILLPVWLRLEEQQRYSADKSRTLNVSIKEMEGTILRLKNRILTAMNESNPWPVSEAEKAAAQKEKAEIQRMEQERTALEQRLKFLKKEHSFYETKEADALLSLTEIVQKVGEIRNQRNLSNAQVRTLLQNAASAA